MQAISTGIVEKSLQLATSGYADIPTNLAADEGKRQEKSGGTNVAGENVLEKSGGPASSPSQPDPQKQEMKGSLARGVCHSCI
jgi:hypothetical protein